MKYIVFALSIIALLVLVGCQKESPSTVTDIKVVQESADVQPVQEDEQIVGMPNPASVYCEQKGYSLEIRDEEGGQAGYCVFPDGGECEEWLFYRGTCGEKWA